METAAHIQTAIAQGVAAALETQRRDAAAVGKAAADSTARTNFITKNRGNTPAIYFEKLGNDPAKWGAEADAARSQFAADFKAMGHRVPNLGGNAGGEAIQGVPVWRVGGAASLIARGLAESEPRSRARHYNADEHINLKGDSHGQHI